MKKTIKISYIILALLMVFGVIFGPITWAYTYDFESTYDEYAQSSVIIDGKVGSKRYKRGFRTGQHYVSIKYRVNEREHYDEIEIQAPLAHHLVPSQSVKLFYSPKLSEKIKLVIENQSRFRPPILTPHLGKWMTILSYLLLIFQISFKHKINDRLDLNPKK